MIKKLTAIGNSYGLVIDRSILELLRITPDSELELSTDGTRLIIEPVRAGKGAPRRPPSRPTPPSRPAPPSRPTRPGKTRPPEPRYGFPKKQPW